MAVTLVGLTGVAADRHGDHPEEEGERQRAAQHDHVGHHLDGFFHQHVRLRSHADGRAALRETRVGDVSSHDEGRLLFSYLSPSATQRRDL